MFIKNIMLALLAISPAALLAQGKETPPGALKKKDKFAVAVQAAPAAGAEYRDVSPVLHFNSQSNYYWYGFKTKWDVGQQYRLVFKHLPAAGLLYVFGVDGLNTPVIYGALDVDSLRTTGQNPAMAAATLKYAGQERVCIWYTPKPLPDYEVMIMGIEFTHGDFIERNNSQLGTRLFKLDHRGWWFNKREIGFTYRRGIPENEVLPVVIEFDVN